MVVINLRLYEKISNKFINSYKQKIDISTYMYMYRSQRSKRITTTVISRKFRNFFNEKIIEKNTPFGTKIKSAANTRYSPRRKKRYFSTAHQFTLSISILCSRTSTKEKISL